MKRIHAFLFNGAEVAIEKDNQRDFNPSPLFNADDALLNISSYMLSFIYASHFLNKCSESVMESVSPSIRLLLNSETISKMKYLRSD